MNNVSGEIIEGGNFALKNFSKKCCPFCKSELKIYDKGFLNNHEINLWGCETCGKKQVIFEDEINGLNFVDYIDGYLLED